MGKGFPIAAKIYAREDIATSLLKRAREGARLT